MDLLPVAIRALRPAVTRDEAVTVFTAGLSGRWRRLAIGPLRSVALVYVPFRLYRVTMTVGARRETAILGVDAATGMLDFYRFDDVPTSPDLVSVSTRNHLDPALPEASTHEIVATRLARMMYRRLGFFAGARSRLDVLPAGADVHIPYWTGFFGRRDAASLVAMDAVRRQIEGVKVRRAIEQWLNELRTENLELELQNWGTRELELRN